MKRAFRKNSKASLLMMFMLLITLALSACEKEHQEEPRYEFVDYKVFINEDAEALYGTPALPLRIAVTVRNAGGDREIRDGTLNLFDRDVSLVNKNGGSYSNWRPEAYKGGSPYVDTFRQGETAAVTYSFETIPEDGQYVLNFSFDGTRFSTPIEVNRESSAK